MENNYGLKWEAPKAQSGPAKSESPHEMLSTTISEISRGISNARWTKILSNKKYIVRWHQDSRKSSVLDFNNRVYYQIL